MPFLVTEAGADSFQGGAGSRGGCRPFGDVRNAGGVRPDKTVRLGRLDLGVSA
jgi:hypothetical protein